MFISLFDSSSPILEETRFYCDVEGKPVVIQACRDNYIVTSQKRLLTGRSIPPPIPESGGSREGLKDRVGSKARPRISSSSIGISLKALAQEWIVEYREKFNLDNITFPPPSIDPGLVLERKDFRFDSFFERKKKKKKISK